eukprot:COSAG05_NODE_1047_length_6041_cov_141.646247_6_plen_173_part_00
MCLTRLRRADCRNGGVHWLAKGVFSMACHLLRHLLDLLPTQTKWAIYDIYDGPTLWVLVCYTASIIYNKFYSRISTLDQDRVICCARPIQIALLYVSQITMREIDPKLNLLIVLEWQQTGRRPSCATWAAATWTPDQKLEHHNGVRCVTYRVSQEEGQSSASLASQIAVRVF